MPLLWRAPGPQEHWPTRRGGAGRGRGQEVPEQQRPGSQAPASAQGWSRDAKGPAWGAQWPDRTSGWAAFPWVQFAEHSPVTKGPEKKQRIPLFLVFDQLCFRGWMAPGHVSTTQVLSTGVGRATECRGPPGGAAQPRTARASLLHPPRPPPGHLHATQAQLKHP